ncbi:hypothetical protein A2954_06335 [Candidatus Roizmanbacteria bacterium RIFCSPLOWO2_01_FULL_37_12]|uniref:Uncharacterized protein n=1 Tax=Candidatus Roizmanbacteria bacterium RIFCSPLOWO2_01_FULL_37_12 TaxID=1802056 RepID=A0A1F7IAU6_9BACT|nr:MAG: hypothetical protein A2768_01675 [Candidatus Roizmanbacteria bacterium RIFCSPHIGHO2_01_FULL_37_16]OGK25773.1 MAG: hypothetical protein A3D76_02180 [Candidatus Roizmanbacteria bacterium RIFCSPHIGHO2_02_FULL_37_9b]OGK40475.1 MAG: hypothetical protein A2954_06335 [Candidatus Roizmanbacteria bacterium RIFCSPLOWO2_01_FULL_37_12]
MEKLLRSNDKPEHIFIEIHTNYLRKFGSSAGEVVNLLRSFGYCEEENKVWQRNKDFLCHFIYKGA